MPKKLALTKGVARPARSGTVGLLAEVRGLILTAREQVLPDRFEKVFRGHYEITSGRLKRCMFVFVLVNNPNKERTLRMIRSRLRELPLEVEIQIGRLAGSDERDVGFEPLDRII